MKKTITIILLLCMLIACAASAAVYAAGTPAQGCSYFVLVIHSTADGSTMQISELELYGTVS